MKSLIRIGLPYLFITQLSLMASAQSDIITTYAGPGLPVNGSLAVDEAIGGPSAVASDGTGGFYVAVSSQNRVYQVAADGRINLVAGNGIPGFSGDGGTAIAAQLSHPTGVVVDTVGNLLIADSDNNRIRKVRPSGFISTVAGDGTADFSGDGGPAASAQLNYPSGLAVDALGNLFIADSGNHCIRKVTPGGVISTVAGSGIAGFSGDGEKATSAQLNRPTGVAVDGAFNLFIADSGNHCIRKVTPGGAISTVAGNGTAGFSGDGGPAASAQLSRPTGVATDTAGNLFITDHDNNCIRKITPDGVISTVAGTGSAGFSGDGGPATSAQLNYPMGIALDSAGNLFIADYDNNRIRKVMQGNSITSFFPQVAVGNGYSTLFAVTNTGSFTASGTIILKNPQGNPLNVESTLADSDGISQSVLLGSAFSLTVPAGETVLLLANSLSAEDSVQIGWGQLQSPSGLLTGEATVRLVNWSNPANSSDSNDAYRGSSRGSRRKSRQAESLGSSLCK